MIPNILLSGKSRTETIKRSVVAGGWGMHKQSTGILMGVKTMIL